ncbi:Aim21 [Kluyveromyces lactis]|nr:Aim21 [Kluyveromyces lactis]
MDQVMPKVPERPRRRNARSEEPEQLRSESEFEREKSGSKDSELDLPPVPKTRPNRKPLARSSAHASSDDVSVKPEPQIQAQLQPEAVVETEPTVEHPIVDELEAKLPVEQPVVDEVELDEPVKQEVEPSGESLPEESLIKESLEEQIIDDFADEPVEEEYKEVASPELIDDEAIQEEEAENPVKEEPIVLMDDKTLGEAIVPSVYEESEADVAKEPEETPEEPSEAVAEASPEVSPEKMPVSVDQLSSTGNLTEDAKEAPKEEQTESSEVTSEKTPEEMPKETSEDSSVNAKPSSKEATPSNTSPKEGSPATQKKKQGKSPPVPKKPSSKIAAFQQMFQNQQFQPEHTPSPKEPAAPKTGGFSGNRAQFAQNLNGMIALPGMAQLTPALAKRLGVSTSSDDAETGAEVETKDTKDEAELPKVPARSKKTRGPHKRLPKTVASIEKVETKSTSNISVVKTWSISFKPDLTERADDQPMEAELTPGEAIEPPEPASPEDVEAENLNEASPEEPLQIISESGNSDESEIKHASDPSIAQDVEHEEEVHGEAEAEPGAEEIALDTEESNPTAFIAETYDEDNEVETPTT